jgi:hypothetical protein
MEQIGDGLCNDNTNTLECNYDGEDCCQEITWPSDVTLFCQLCICHLTGISLNDVDDLCNCFA